MENINTNDDKSTLNNANPPQKKQISDFIIGQKIGKGAYSKVIVGKDKLTSNVYAIKVIKKALIVKLNKRESVFRERNTMEKLRGHPFFVNIIATFQDPEHLCRLFITTVFVMNYARRGELLRYINKLKGFNVETTSFYASEIVSALEFMHGKNIIHRDLKPENVLIGMDYHIMITDFGTSKIIEDAQENINHKRTSSFVGTAQYVSPELLNDKQICKSSDLWSLGVTIYQMITAEWPFHGVTEYYIFEKIRRLDYTFPEYFPDVCMNLVKQLIVLDPHSRLGDDQMGGYATLKAHSLFDDVDWEHLTDRQPPRQMTLVSLDLLPTVDS